MSATVSASPTGVATEWVRPASIEAACSGLRDAAGTARVAAGCTAVPLAELSADPTVDQVIDLAGLPGLCGVEPTESGLRVGAMTTLAELAESPEVAERAPILAEVAGGVADEVLRGVATIGGNVAPRVARQLEFASALVALRARIELAGSERDSVDAAELCDREFTLAESELIVGFAVPRQKGAWAYRKLTTNLDSYGIANLAIAASPSDRPRVVAALGESIPQRLPEAEAELAMGRLLDATAATEVAAAATAGLYAIDDALASADYRRRALAAAIARELERLAGSDAGG